MIRNSLTSSTLRRNSVLWKIYLLLCFAFAIFITYVYLARNKYLADQLLKEEEPILEISNTAASDPANIEYSKNNLDEPPDLVLNDPKRILLWTSEGTPPFNYLGSGRQSFINNGCQYTNCYVTAYTRSFEGNITDFDAIAFNGRNLKETFQSELPQMRSPHQKYIFFNMEANVNQLVCDDWYDDFFNWTATYRLDSDIVYNYIYIRHKNGAHAGPRIDMNWVTDMKEIDEKIKKKLKSKKIAAAWFVSHCDTRSHREEYVLSLIEAFVPYGLRLDTYGLCGTLTCLRNDFKCNLMVADDYYFYLSFENAFAEDYVTEKLLIALNNGAVPIVYGGANYSRFLPPGSYLDANALDPVTLAATMADIIATPTKYYQFFRWRQHYSYSDPERVENVCNVCAALNDRNMMTPSVYEHFRSWWNPDWELKCQLEE